LFRYYAEPKWADDFLDGRMRFWSLSYFRDREDKSVRGDPNEGTGIFAPEGGLEVSNHTQRTRFNMPAHALTSQAVCDEIFVFCTSRTLSSRLWDEFGALVCIEITDVPAFCSRVAAALPEGARFPGRPGRERLGQRVDYYQTSDAVGTRWALPDRIALSKLRTFAWQDEFRLVFSTSGALDFQNVTLTLEPRDAAPPLGAAGHPHRDIAAASLRDICQVHDARPSAID
jgi:hypothetical protein